jgi:SNF2 family DNA or RNA helicase
VTVYKFVSKDTVDADIYEMQERKAKMNAAIMESSSSTASKSAEVGKQERKAILQSVMQKFLSPDGKKKPKQLETLVL